MALAILEKKLADRTYRIRALPSLEALDLAPTVVECLAPAIGAYALSTVVPAAAFAEVAKALQGAKLYPQIARAAIAASSVAYSSAPGAQAGLFVEVQGLVDQRDSEHFSQRQWELAQLTFWFVEHNFSDFLGAALREAGIKWAKAHGTETPPIPDTDTQKKSDTL